jgi:WD40 repeat protein
MLRSLPPLAVAALLALPPFAAAADDEKKKDPPPIPVVTIDHKEAVVYEKEIEPILINKCVHCHSTSTKKEGRLDLGSYATMMRGGKSGPAIVPGKSAESLLCKLAGKTIRPMMPPKGEDPLTPQELALIKLWVDQGAKPPTGTVEPRKIVLTAPPVSVHPVRGVAISPDKSAVVASRGNQIYVFDAGSGNYVRSLIDPDLKTPEGKEIKAAHLSLVESLAFSPDGRWVASGGFREVILWDAQTGALRYRFTGFAERVVALSFSPDGKTLATGGGAPTEDGEIKVFEVPDGKLLLDIKNGHSDQVFGVAFSPDGRYLATCSADKFVKVWRMAPGRWWETQPGKFVKQFEGHTHHVMDVGWKADGKLLASAGADNAVKVWSMDTGEQVRTINAHGKQVTRLVFVGKTGTFATCSGDTQVRFWNVDNGGNVRNFQGNTDYLYALGVSPDGAVVAAGGEEGVVRLYNGANGQLIKTLAAPGAEAPKK